VAPFLMAHGVDTINTGYYNHMYYSFFNEKN